MGTFDFSEEITIWTDGRMEFNTSLAGTFERHCDRFWRPLGVERGKMIIGKRNPEDNALVGRAHQTDDYEFYIPHLMKAKTEGEFIRLGAWWRVTMH